MITFTQIQKMILFWGNLAKLVHEVFQIIVLVKPYPYSHFYFDINFGDKLVHPKEKRPGSLLLF